MIFKNAQLPQRHVSTPVETEASAKCEASRSPAWTGAAPDALSADSLVTSHLTGHLGQLTNPDTQTSITSFPRDALASMDQ